MSNEVEQISNDNFFTYVVDPNPPFGNNIVPEDLFTYVSLRAMPRARSVIETDGTYTSDLFGERGVQFVSTTKQGDGEYMTTNYTNIGGSNPTEEEAFGIQNIQVKMGAKSVPQVSIEFVDVRGAGLFNGYEQTDEKGGKYNSSKFSTFFRQPYPLFELTIKGFYGKAISYCLHLMNFNSRFDAERGNFIINAEFVGYTDAFLADVLMGEVMAITSTGVGSKSLQGITQRMRKTNPEAVDLISLREFTQSLGQLTRIAEEVKATSKEFKQLKVVNTLLGLLDKLEKTIGLPVNKLQGSVYGQTLPISRLRKDVDQVFVRDVGVISEQKEADYDIIVEDITKFIKEYNALVDDNVATFSYLNTFKIKSFDLPQSQLAKVIDESFVDELVDLISEDQVSDSVNIITEFSLRSRLSLPNGSEKRFFLANFHPIRKEVTELKSKIGEKKNLLEVDVNEFLNNTLNEELGFDLSIQNVFNIIIGNVEAYMDVFYNYCVAADSPSLREGRIRDLTNIRTDINSGDQRIYPFPDVLDADTGERVWLGDIVGENNPNFPELEFVKMLINSSISSDTQRDKDNLSDKTISTVVTTSEDYVPLHPQDVTNFGGLDSLQYNGNQIPLEIADNLFRRSKIAFEYSLFSDSRLEKLAKLEGAYDASQIQNKVVSDVISNYNTQQFASSILDSVNLDDSIKLGDGSIFLVETLDDIDGFINQPTKNLPKQLESTIESFDKSLENVLIPTKNKKNHKTLTNSLYITGDLTDSFWLDEVKARLLITYKSRTTNNLDDNKPVDATVSTLIRDLTVFDGRVNKQIDYAKNKDRQLKYINNARKWIGIDRIGGGSIFEKDYYTLASDTLKAYFFLSTLPLSNITDLDDIFDIASVYTLSKAQLAWLGAQFWRAKSQSAGFDVFEELKTNTNLATELGTRGFNNFLTDLESFENKTQSFLPNFNNFATEFSDKLISYFENFILNEYKPNTLQGVEQVTKEYVRLTSNGIEDDSRDYIDHKQFYNSLLGFLTQPLRVIVSKPSACFLPQGGITLSEERFTSYVVSYLESFKKTARGRNFTSIGGDSTVEISTSSEGFYTNDKDIKIDTYNHLKSIYDKWIGGIGNSQIHNACSYFGGKQRNSAFIDRFHFIDRAWNYIGDKASINPKTFQVLSDNPQTPLRSLIGRLLQDSGKFTFFALPSYVNYKNIADVKDMWKPFTEIDTSNSGASFICMYVGGSSKTLDIGENQIYANDGFDLRETTKNEVPKAFKDRRLPKNIDTLEDDEKFKYNMVAFRVGYADQNQAIFKSFNLDQAENRATMESMSALSDLVDRRGGTKRLYKGTNLYNIYGSRSYTTSIGCMGNMMIHPMSYYQLDNVPFFHGAYMITSVAHDVKPHYVETSFTGYRMPRFIYPIIDQSTTYMNIPLNETLYKPDDLAKPIIRSLTDDEDGYVSNGEASAVQINDINVTDLLEAEEANNVLMRVNLSGNFTNYFISPKVTPETLDKDIARVFNPNNPITFSNTKLGLCYRWTRQALGQIGVLEDPVGSVDAWTAFSGLDDEGIKYIPEDVFSRNLTGWTNEELQKIVPDGSLLFCYYPTSRFFYRAIDIMGFRGMSNYKISQLQKYRDLDNIKNRCFSKINFCDPTPISKRKFLYEGYLSSHKRSIWQNVIPNDGAQIPYIPITHSAVFMNGHCFHQLKTVKTRPSNTMRIVAYYPFKEKLYQKVGASDSVLDRSTTLGTKTSNVVSNAINSVTNLFQ